MKNYIDSFMRYRFLLVELVKKGIKLKYRRSYLGLIWTLLEPLLTMIVLTFVFGSMLGSKGGVYGPELYPVYILCGRLLYSCFSSASKIGMRSIRSNQAMIKKVYVPKYLYPLSSVIYNYVIFLLSLIVLAIVGVVEDSTYMAYYRNSNSCFCIINYVYSSSNVPFNSLRIL